MHISDGVSKALLVGGNSDGNNYDRSVDLVTITAEGMTSVSCQDFPRALSQMAGGFVGGVSVECLE